MQEYKEEWNAKNTLETLACLDRKIRKIWAFFRRNK